MSEEKQKAEQLVEMFYNGTYLKHRALRHAKICVNEILLALPSGEKELNNFYNKVLTELNKM